MYSKAIKWIVNFCADDVMKIMMMWWCDDDEGQKPEQTPSDDGVCEKEVHLIKLNVRLECPSNLNSIFFRTDIILWK